MKNNEIFALNLGKIKGIKNNNYLTLFMLMFCSIVGVGFVSGAEIYDFFTVFGENCYYGIVVFYVLVIFICNKLINNLLITQNDCRKTLKKSNQLKIIVNDLGSFLNVLIVSSAMFSGLRYFVKRLYNNNYICIYFCLIFVIFIMVLLGIKGLKKLDYFVIIFIIFMVYSLLFGNDFSLVFEKNNRVFSDKIINVNLLLSCVYPVLYVFMNMFQMKPLIESSGIKIKNKKGGFWFSFFFASILSGVLFVFVIFLKNNPHYTNFSMPFLEYFRHKGGIISSVFCLGLIIALLSTLLSSLVGLKFKIQSAFNLKDLFCSTFSFLIAFFVGFLPFNVFSGILYPILGAINLIIFVFC